MISTDVKMDQPDVIVGESLIQLLEVRVVDMLEYEGGGPADRVLHHAVQGDHVRAPAEIL